MILKYIRSKFNKIYLINPQRLSKHNMEILNGVEYTQVSGSARHSEMDEDIV